MQKTKRMLDGITTVLQQILFPMEQSSRIIQIILRLYFLTMETAKPIGGKLLLGSLQSRRPTVPATQAFCAVDNPTLGNIEATGNNRYFSTATSQTELSPSTPLVDGRTYYISAQGENCESIDRLAVTVSVGDGTPVENPEPGIVCESDVQTIFDGFTAIENYYLGLISGTDIPGGGTLGKSGQELADEYNDDSDGLGDFSTTYTFGEGACDQVVLTVTIVAEETATVDSIDSFSVCSSTESYDLSIRLTGDNTPGGTFTYTDSGDVITGGMLDVSSDGTINVTYTVTENDEATCLTGTASTNFTVTVGQNNAIPVETLIFLYVRHR